MKILYFTKYSRLGASSRLRSYQYFPRLKKENIEIRVLPLFGDRYLQNIYQKKVPIPKIIKAYIKRFFQLFTVFRYNLIVLEYEIFPYMPPFAEFFLRIFGVKYIVDYDDAIFHNYDLSQNKIIRKLLSKKISAVMKYSAVVTAGNNYLKKYAENAGAKDVVLLPTVIDIDRYRKKKYNNSIKDIFVIGWIGSPSTIKYVKNILPVLEEVSKKHNIELRIIGAKEDLKSTIPVHFIEWTESTEAEEIRKFDVGVMPLENTPWEDGKCGYKLIQYMASAIPVIASDVGVNREIVQHGINGYLANTFNDWKEAISYLINNRNLLPSLGFEARRTVEEKYNLNVTQKILIQKIKKNDI